MSDGLPLCTNPLLPLLFSCFGAGLFLAGAFAGSRCCLRRRSCFTDGVPLLEVRYWLPPLAAAFLAAALCCLARCCLKPTPLLADVLPEAWRLLFGAWCSAA
eukprot:s3699_g6.t1